MIVEVFGPEPPCARCMRALEIVKQAVKELQLNCEVEKIDAYSKSTIAKYGLVLTPAVAIDGKVFIAGRIPSVDEVKRILVASTNIKGQKTE
jgi:small redox-active disulfide protein 2